MDNNGWLSQYRRLWNGEDSTFERKKEEIVTIHRVIAAAFQTEFAPVIFKSHNMNISRMHNRKTILCDVHFFDIAQLLASSFYVSLTKDVEKLTDLLLANSFICSDDVSTAYEYAKRFISGPYTAAYIMPSSSFHKEIAYSRQMQISFAIAHEMAHEKYQHPSGYYAPIMEYFGKKIDEVVEAQNQLAEQINKIDLSILRDDLIKIPYKDAFSYPTPENYQEIICKSFGQFDRLYAEYSQQLSLPWKNKHDQRIYFTIACENYLRDKKERVIDKEQMIEESVCDIIALIELFNLQIPTMTRQESINHAIEAYVLCLLAQDMILSAMSIQKGYTDVDEQHVDYIHVRLEKEGLLFETITELYELLFHSDEQIDWSEVKARFIQAKEIAEIMYAKFSEVVSGIDLDLVDNNYISSFDPQWRTFVSKTERYLTIPV